MDIDSVLTLHPPFHRNADGSPISWALGDEVLRAIAARVGDHSRTLETGSGMSTVVFLAAGADHTAVTPVEEELSKIKLFCSQQAISTQRLTSIVERSEFALPNLPREPLDMALIDGRHGFPTPFIDWFFTADRLRLGGFMVVDDTQLVTGRILRDFMAEDGNWEMDVDLGKTCFFRKVGECVIDGEWNTQPWVRSHS